MPYIGEQRSANGETRTWNGSSWEAAQSTDDLLKRADAITNRPSDPEGGGNRPKSTYVAPKIANPGPGTYFQQHPNVGQETSNPLLAMLNSGYETAAKTGYGLLRSPDRMIRSLPSIPGQVVEGLAGQQGLPALLQDPSLLKEVPSASLNALKYIGENPEAGGDLLGQIGMGHYAPEIGNVALKGAAKAGEGVSKVGSLLERGGQAAIDSKVGGFGIPGLGVLEALIGNHPVAGMTTAAVPYLVKYGGKGITAAGDALSGLRRYTKDWSGDASAQLDPHGPASRSAYGDSAALDLADRIGGEALPYEGSQPPGRKGPSIGQITSTPEDNTSGGNGLDIINAAYRREAAKPENAARIKSLMDSFNGMPPQRAVAGYHAQDLLENPGSEAFTAREFSANKPLADEAFGANIDLLGRPKSAGSMELPDAWKSLPNDAEMATDMAGRFRRGGLDRSRRLTQELDIPSELPMDPMERMAALTAERYGRRFRPE